jgi:hypothetical protein
MQNQNKRIFAVEDIAQNDGPVTWIQVMQIQCAKHIKYKTVMFVLQHFFYLMKLYFVNAN